MFAPTELLFRGGMAHSRERSSQYCASFCLLYPGYHTKVHYEIKSLFCEAVVACFRPSFIVECMNTSAELDPMQIFGYSGEVQPVVDAVHQEVGQEWSILCKSQKGTSAHVTAHSYPQASMLVGWSIVCDQRICPLKSNPFRYRTHDAIAIYLCNPATTMAVTEGRLGDSHSRFLYIRIRSPGSTNFAARGCARRSGSSRSRVLRIWRVVGMADGDAREFF
jgi:hypothetical protein